MKKISIEQVRFSSGKATVDYRLPDSTDPESFECAAISNIEQLNSQYESELHLQRNHETNYKGCLFSVIGLVILMVGLVISIIF